MHLGLHATALGAQLLTTLIPLALVLVAVLRRTTGSGTVYGVGPTGLWFHSVFSPAAAADLGRVFASTRHIAAATTVGSLVVLVVSVVGVPASFQRIAELVWGLPEAPVTRALLRQGIWIVTLVLFIAALSIADTVALRAGAGVYLVLVGNCALAAPYLLVTQRLVLGSRVAYRKLLPGSLITAGGLLGVLAVALRFASSAVTGTVAQFGPIGIAFALQGLILAVAYVVGAGVLLGAELGQRNAGRGRNGFPSS